MLKKVLLVLFLAIAAMDSRGQTPAPAAVQPALAAKPAAAATTVDPRATDASIATLKQIKAANEEMLKRQQALLEQLDALQQAADQIKIYTKRS